MFRGIVGEVDDGGQPGRQIGLVEEITALPSLLSEHLDPLLRVLAPGAVRNAYDFEELTRHIDAYLADPALDREKRKALADQEVTHNRGCAGKAIADYISRLLESA